MEIDKEKLFNLYNIKKFQGIKQEIENSEIKNKDHLLDILNAVIIIEEDLLSYNGLVQKYGERNILQEIENELLKKLSVLGTELEKL